MFSGTISEVLGGHYGGLRIKAGLVVCLESPMHSVVFSSSYAVFL